jgi:hypothetical protein
MTATGQNDRVGNITLQDYNASVVDTINSSSEIMKRVVSRPERWNGRSYSSPIFTTNSNLGQSFKGTETFDTSIDYATQQMTWYPTGYAQPVGVSIVERSINATPSGVIDLYKSSYQYAQNSMITALANIFYGFGNGNDFDGLGVIVDDGTSTSAYAGLTRATFPTINGSVTAASGGVLSLDVMAAADDAATISGNQSETPNVIMSNQTVWSLYESLLSPTVSAHYGGQGGSFVDGSTNVKGNVSQADSLWLKGGATSVSFRGKPLVRDQKATSGTMFGLNEDYFYFKSLKLQGLDLIATSEDVTSGAYESYKVSAFQFREPMMPVNQLAEVGIFVMYGQFYCENPNRNFKVTGITTT